ncbi:GIY-YIG nuclease family protein [Terasakiella pusilla]|uniref:GIY-YIG nuclease family protein n=1 Tax=Terasakiella pusilla TaxID=64973 RepID=UPI003AA89E65
MTDFGKTLKPFHIRHMKRFYVYILCDRSRGSMYVGVTSDLIRRVYEHRAKTVDGYTKRKGIDRLVYFDVIDQAPDAILYEKKLKKWKRDWKFNLIERSNPHWSDLYPHLF